MAASKPEVCCNSSWTTHRTRLRLPTRQKTPTTSPLQSEEESEEVSDECSETPDNDKDPDFIPLDDDEESFDEVPGSLHRVDTAPPNGVPHSIIRVCRTQEAYNELTTTWRCKWTCDGAESIDEMIEKLQAAIEELRQFQRDGWVLDGEIGDDYGTLLSPAWVERCRVRGVPPMM